MPRNTSCQPPGSMSDDTAKAANTPTPTHAHDAHRGALEHRCGGADDRRDAAHQQHDAQRLAGDAANGEVADAIGGEPHAEHAPVRRPLLGREADVPAGRAQQVPADARQQHERQREPEAARLASASRCDRCRASCTTNSTTPATMATSEMICGTERLMFSGRFSGIRRSTMTTSRHCPSSLRVLLVDADFAEAHRRHQPAAGRVLDEDARHQLPDARRRPRPSISALHRDAAGALAARAARAT